MKTLAFSLLFLSIALSSAFAKTVTVEGTDARSIMEALASSGFEITNIDGEWSGKTLSVETKELLCRYNVVSSPDNWMNNVRCYKGSIEEGEVLNNSLALALAISNYADIDAALGSRYLSVNAVNCSLVYDSKAYSCELEVFGND